MSKFVFAAALAVAMLSSQAFAREPAIALPSKIVSSSGVNFQDPADVKNLYARLSRAAHEVCNAYATNPRVTDADQSCASKALANAIRDANKPLLTAEHQCGCSDLLYLAHNEPAPARSKK